MARARRNPATLRTLIAQADINEAASATVRPCAVRLVQTSPQPASARWHEMARECPEGHDAAAHCWPKNDTVRAHVTERGGPIRCVLAKVQNGRAVPLEPLQGWERMSDAQCFAELGARV